jgi:hypothetical protein
MAVKSADRKPEKYVGPDGKTRIRMVPVDREVVKSEAKDGDGVNIVKDRPFKGKPMDRKPGKVGIKFSDMRKSKWAKNADANPKRAKAMGEAYEMEPPSPDEKSMAMRQAKFIQYVGEELMEHMEQENDFPEWMQNKLSEFHQKAKDMHAVLAGEYEDEDDEEMDEAIKEYGGPPISRAKYLKQKPMKERELTPGEMKKREKYAQDLPDAEFKKRYGDRWKSVKIATATKMAKGEK